MKHEDSFLSDCKIIVRLVR
uniref:Uncharacterized protein n=1 Tax=Arundo donax TaxID=35708 RepID=A0A0A9B8Q8_ARUDO